jgi:chaperonin GroES
MAARVKVLEELQPAGNSPVARKRRIPARPPQKKRARRATPFFEHRETPMKFRPLHDRVVVKRIDAEDKTAGGIIIPDTAKEKPSQGEIVAVGPGGRDEAGRVIAIDLKVGDRVLFGKWSGTEVKIDGAELLIMKESDIMGVLTDIPVAKKKAA